MVLVITSTYNGKPPDNAKQFDQWLASPEASERLQGVQFSVFGCGNQQWAATFMAFASKVHNCLLAAGGLCLVPLATGDMDTGEAEATFSRWDVSFCVALLRSHGLPLPKDITASLYPRLLEYDTYLLQGKGCADLPLAEVQAVRAKSMSAAGKLFAARCKCFEAVPLCNRELLAGAAGRSTRHVEIALPEGHTYTAGDHLGVLAANPEAVVLAYLNYLRLPHDAVLKVELPKGDPASALVPVDGRYSAWGILSWCFDLQQPATRVQLRALSQLAADEQERARLEALSEWDGDGVGTSTGPQGYLEYIAKPRRTLLEVLVAYPSAVPSPRQLFGLLPPNKPRYYSISSSPPATPGALPTTVNVVAGQSPAGRQHQGLASNWLKTVGERMRPTFICPEPTKMLYLVAVKDTGSSFRPPPDPSTPIIMIGPGTGVAPFRGFILDRVADGARANTLFFGCRNESDYLYQTELEAWVEGGWLSLHVALSRAAGQPKTYVQDLITKEGRALVDLVKRGAHIYICGDASQMAPAVKAVFVRLLGADYVEAMGDQGRYCEDVWAAQSLG